MKFEVFPTKKPGKAFDLADAAQRREYFAYKCGPEIAALQKYLETGSFIMYLLGKKNSGKGTYAKMLAEVVSPDRITHVSVGDLVRTFDDVVKHPDKRQEFLDFLHKKYRGPVSPDEIIASLEGRSTQKLLSTELILALLEKEISRFGKKAIILDGFPRDFDQVSFSLFFKSLVDYRQDPDIFVLIDVPMAVIDERIKYRVVCPVCHTSRNAKLLPTKEVKHDGQFYLLCDNTHCSSVQSGKPVRLVPKEGDDKGIEPIKSRLEKDGQLMEKVAGMHGIGKIFLRSSVSADQANEKFDDYEITPEYHYALDSSGYIGVEKKPWIIADDHGVSSNSLMPPPVVVALIKQLVALLGV